MSDAITGDEAGSGSGADRRAGAGSLPSSSGESSSGEIVEGGGELVSARGTADGLILQLLADADPLELQAALRDFMISRSGFLRGAEVFIEWLPESPAGDSGEDLQSQVQSILQQEFSVTAKDLPESKRTESERAAAPESDDARIDAGDREPEFGNGVVHLTVEGEPGVLGHERVVDRLVEPGCVGAGIVGRHVRCSCC